MKLLYKLTSNMPCRLITREDGSPYLERYYVGQLFGATFYLHRFVSCDQEPHLHNHPWGWSRALVLAGGYEEEVVVDLCPHVSPSGCITETRSIRWWNRIDGNRFHRISSVKPDTWTLFFHGERQKVLIDGVWRRKGWGFLESVNSCFTVFTPRASRGGKWWLKAPVGGDSGRQPLKPSNNATVREVECEY